MGSNGVVSGDWHFYPIPLKSGVKQQKGKTVTEQSRFEHILDLAKDLLDDIELSRTNADIFEFPGGPADVTQNCDSDTGGGQGLNRSTQKAGGGLPGERQCMIIGTRRKMR